MNLRKNQIFCFAQVKSAHLVKAGSHSHLHSARSDVFLLKLQMMARVVGIRTHVVLTHTSFGDSRHRPLGDTRIWGK